MSSFQSFLMLVDDYKNSCKELSNFSTFSKRLPISNKSDLISFSNGRDSKDLLKNELVGLINESQLKDWEIKIISYYIEKNKIFLKLVRSSVVKAVFVEIFERQSAFGSTNKFHDKTYEVCCAECRRGLIHLRVVTAARVVTALITRGGGTVTDAPADNTETVYLGHSNAISQSRKHFILVNQVTMSGDPDMSEADFKELRRGDLLAMGDHKDISASSLNKIIDAAITFDMLSIKLEKPIVLDSSSQPKSTRKSNCKGATFVLYNYARLCVILDRFNQYVANNIFKPLLPLKDVNYNLLSDEDEWQLVFGFLVDWPTIVAECQDLDQPKLHRITGFLSSLASTFSVYYRHSRVLNDGLAHMVPVMEARIYLLLAIKQLFLAAFSILGIDAPTTM